MTESRYKLHLGDCLEVIKGMEANSVDAVVSDPPYGLSFMGKDWDKGVPGEAFWAEALRVAKPGAHLLAFGGTRTFHRLACAIEDAGWELRDTIMYVYGSGFPKSHNVSKAIDREAGKLGIQSQGANYAGGEFAPREKSLRSDYGYQYTPATAEAEQWEGWGTALKPSFEPIIVARKPIEGTVAANVLAYGTGGLNIDGCRVGTDGGGGNGLGSHFDKLGNTTPLVRHREAPPSTGRWPANFCHDGSEEVLGLFPETTSGKPCGKRNATTGFSSGITSGAADLTGYGDSGTAARFFYCAKSSKEDRDEGCEALEAKQVGNYAQDEWSRKNMGNTPDAERKPVRNNHPTVKPVSLMKWLCRLVTPPDGVILDPFMGSGSTGKGAILEGFRFVGIDITAEYVEIARARLEFAEVQYRNAAGEIVVTAKEKERGMVSLFDWAVQD